MRKSALLMFWVEQQFLCQIQGRNKENTILNILWKSIIAGAVDDWAHVGICIAAGNW